MQVNGSNNVYINSNPLPSRDNNRLDEQPSDRARNKTNSNQPINEPDVSKVDISEAAQQAAAQQQVIAVNASESNQATYQYYPSERNENLTSSQQKALQAYDANQQLGREDDASGEFLSGLDIFV